MKDKEMLPHYMGVLNTSDRYGIREIDEIDARTK